MAAQSKVQDVGVGRTHPHLPIHKSVILIQEWISRAFVWYRQAGSRGKHMSVRDPSFNRFRDPFYDYLFTYC